MALGATLAKTLTALAACKDMSVYCQLKSEVDVVTGWVGDAMPRWRGATRGGD